MSWTKAVLIFTIILSVFLIFTSMDYKFVKPNSPAGMASCPECQKTDQSGDPDHSFFVLVILLALAILGSHTLRHFCKNTKAKYALLGLFVFFFIILVSLFGITVTAPTGAFAVAAKRTASIIAAIGVIALFLIIALEVSRSDKTFEPWEGDSWEK